jgi:hypothetical protein
LDVGLKYLRLLKLVIFRAFSLNCWLYALLESVKLVLGARAVFMVQREFPDVSPLKLGGLHGEMIFAPFLLAAFSAALGFVVWRWSSRFTAKNQSNNTFQRTPDGAAE